MTVLLHDADMDLRSRGGLNLPAALVNDLVYADDTLVVAVEQERAELHMNCIARAGSNYALTFNWKKVELMPIRCQAPILKPDGCEIPSKSSLVYLGSTLSASGDIISEVSRRLGMARADFTALERVWKHSSLNSRSKLWVFNACVASKLLYCLHTAWLNKADLRRLDAFQASCLRKILRIPHSFISRVSNAEVLSRANHRMLSKILQYRQIMLLKRVADLPSEDVMRTCVFQSDSFNLPGVQGSRRRGRPRKRWAVEVYRFVKSMADYDRCSLDSLWQLPLSQWKWRAANFCFGA